MAKLRMQAERKIIFQSEVGPRAVRTQKGPWKIFSVLNNADTAIAKAELAGGADGLVLTTLESVAALRDVPLHTFSIRNQAGDAAARALVDLIARQPIDPARLNISFGLSDLKFADELARLGYVGPFSEAHAIAQTPSEELAVILTLVAKHQNSNHAISVRLLANHNVFETLAKFRAMRILWERILPGRVLNLHGEVGAPTGDDHEHYILSCVAACFGAGLGGADSISILPFNSEGHFERRMVRNIQNILLKESHLGEVADAAAGAGYVEHLTRELYAAAWERFKL
jgi:methylmalonyl-CoA mutase